MLLLRKRETEGVEVERGWKAELDCGVEKRRSELRDAEANCGYIHFLYSCSKEVLVPENDKLARDNEIPSEYYQLRGQDFRYSYKDDENYFLIVDAANAQEYRLIQSTRGRYIF